MNSLPYTDTKPQGAADFYFAINATFRFILAQYGEEGFERWLTKIGQDYFAPVNRQWKSGGLPFVARYWRDFFDAEPGSEVRVVSSGDEVVVRIDRCPAITHLKAHEREIVPEYCRHCAHLGRSRAESAGLSMNVSGGNGSCVHRYAAGGLLMQDLDDVLEVS